MGAVGLSVLAASLTACGYRFAARPELPGGADRVAMGEVVHHGAEPAVGQVLAAKLAAQAEASDRLGPSDLVLSGRVVRVTSAPEAFPGAVGSAGVYALSVAAEAWLGTAAGRRLRVASATERASYLAGADPSETEMNRRRALERLADALAARLWRRLTAPRPPPSPGEGSE
ncbi:MAG: hypothetical protein D6729_12855 [Deltaproteobacteria bacterium]|nr:MAG: hypothetical protein D6729_12855 [Deltaproteobacteria bacterium]